MSDGCRLGAHAVKKTIAAAALVVGFGAAFGRKILTWLAARVTAEPIGFTGGFTGLGVVAKTGREACS